MINATLFAAGAFVGYHGFGMIIDYLVRAAPRYTQTAVSREEGE